MTSLEAQIQWIEHEKNGIFSMLLDFLFPFDANEFNFQLVVNFTQTIDSNCLNKCCAFDADAFPNWI